MKYFSEKALEKKIEAIGGGGKTYSAGAGLDLNDTVFSIKDSVLAEIAKISDWFELKDGNIHVRNNRGFWSDSFISAGGLSSGGGAAAGNATLSNVTTTGATISADGVGSIAVYSKGYLDTALAQAGKVQSVVGQTGAVTAAQIGSALISEGYELTDHTYTNGTGLSLAGGVFSVSTEYQAKIQSGEDAYTDLHNWFERINIGTEANPVWVIHVKSEMGFYGDSFVSAGGISPGGGSAGGNATLVAQTYGGTLSATGIDPINFYSKEKVDQLLATAGTVQTVAGVSPTSGDIPVASLKSALGLGAAAAYGIGSVASGNTGLVTGGSVYSAINEASWALKTTSISAGTGLEGGGTLASNRTISINPTYQTYISHGERAYNSLGNYVLKSGDTMSGLLTLNHTYENQAGIRFLNTRTQDGGGWAMNIIRFCLADGTEASTLGWFGNQTDPEYIYLGNRAYDGANFRVYANKVAFGTNTIFHQGNANLSTVDWTANQMTANSFKLASSGTQTLTWDANANAWHLSGNFYADGFISAGGLSSGGGTAGADLPAVWTSLRNVTTTASEINSTIKIAEAHIPDMASTYGYLKSADAVADVALNGDYLRVTKNGVNTDLTIPYSTAADHLSTASVWESDNITALKAAFSAGIVARNKGTALYLSHGSASMAFGWFLSGYDSAPHGGWFISNYDVPSFVGISGGNWYEATLLTSSNYTTWINTTHIAHGEAAYNALGNYLPLTGGTMSGTLNAQNILPKTNYTYDLGSSTYGWKNATIRQIGARHLDASNEYTGDHDLYIGWGSVAITDTTHFYYSYQNGNDIARTEYARINSSGLYALTRFGVNGQNTNYTLYVNGNAYVSSDINFGGYITSDYGCLHFGNTSNPGYSSNHNEIVNYTGLLHLNCNGTADGGSGASGQIVISKMGVNGAILDINNILSGTQTFYFPNATGTLALTSDISSALTSYLPLSAGSGKPLTGDLYLGSHAISGATNINSLIYFDTTNSRVGIGTPSPAYKFHIGGSDGNIACMEIGCRHIDSAGERTYADHTLFIGYGSTMSYTSATYFYYSTGTAGTETTTSRSLEAAVNASGFYVANYLGVYGQNTSYRLYVNGTSYLNGAVTTPGLATLGGIKINQNLVLGSGTGGELFWYNNRFYVESYDRTNNIHYPLWLTGSEIVFHVGYSDASEKMRIDTNGYVRIGATTYTPAADLTVDGGLDVCYSSSNEFGGAIGFNRKCTVGGVYNSNLPGWQIHNHGYLAFYVEGSGAYGGECTKIDKNGNISSVGSLSTGGNIDATGTIHSSTGIWSEGYVSAGGLASSSDERLKSGIKDFGYSAEMLMALRPREWDWNEKSYMKGHAAGVVAQELRQVMPYAIVERQYLSVNYDMLHGLEIAGLQDHETRIRQLERENAELKRRLNMN